MPAPVRARVKELWAGGYGLRATQAALAAEGVNLERDAIWRAFVEFSWEPQ